MAQELQKVKIFADGACKGNPDGPGGYGTIVEFLTEDNKTTKIMEYTEGFEVTTNNRMELLGVIAGLESLETASDILIMSDSKYVVDAFNRHWIDNWQKNGWKTATGFPVKNIDLWKRLLNAKQDHVCSFVWVKGHDGHADNERCDYLATSSADGVKFERDENGRLEPVVNKLKKDTGMTKTDIKLPNISLKEVAQSYIDEIKNDLKSYTVTVNGAKFIYDEEGNMVPHPKEDKEKCRKVLETFEKLQKDEKFSKLFTMSFMNNYSGSALLSDLNKTLETFFTGDRTIPFITIEKDSEN